MRSVEEIIIKINELAIDYKIKGDLFVFENKIKQEIEQYRDELLEELMQWAKSEQKEVDYGGFIIAICYSDLIKKIASLKSEGGK